MLPLILTRVYMVKLLFEALTTLFVPHAIRLCFNLAVDTISSRQRRRIEKKIKLKYKVDIAFYFAQSKTKSRLLLSRYSSLHSIQL